MNKIFKQSGLALLAIATLALGACTSEYEYDPYASIDNSGVYFAAPEASSKVYTADAERTLTVTLLRQDSTAAQTVRLTSDTEGITLPSEVTFAAGEGSKKVTMPLTLAPGVTDVKLGFADGTPLFHYGLHSYQQQLMMLDDTPVEGIFMSSIAGQMPVEVYLAGNDGGLIKDCYEEGKDILFSVDADGAISVKKQLAFNAPAWGGDVYVQDYESYNGVKPQGYSVYEPQGYPPYDVYQIALAFLNESGLITAQFEYLYIMPDDQGE